MSQKTVKPEKNKLIRFLWILLGSLFVGIGYLGIFVPGLPTTIFLILAAGCYIRSSQRLYNWLINNKLFGQYIKDYYEGKGMPRKSKIVALSMIIIFCSFAIFFVVEKKAPEPVFLFLCSLVAKQHPLKLITLNHCRAEKEVT